MNHDYLEIALLCETRGAIPEILKILRSIPKVKVLSQSSDTQEFTVQMQASPPDVVLVDIRGENKIPLWLEQLIQRLPQTQILVCSENRGADFIIQAMQKGVRELLPLPLSKTDLEAALNRLRLAPKQLQPREGKKPGKILVVTGHKGGVGCTTLAINLAVALSELDGEPVALIDLGRPFPDVKHFLNPKWDHSLADLIDNFSNFDRTFVQSILHPYDSNLAILYGMPGLINQEDLEEIVERMFPILRDMYRYIVIDLGHWLDALFLQVCTEADMVLLLTQFTIPDIKNLEILLPMLLEFSLDRRKFKIIVNRHIRQHIVQLGDLHNIIKAPAFHTLPSDYFSLMKAIDSGTILANVAPRSKLLSSIKKLGTLILKEMGN